MQTMRLLLLSSAAAAGACSFSAAAWETVRPAGQFDRCSFTEAQDADLVRQAGNLSGTTKPDDWRHIAGWVEYDLEVPSDGWYELVVPAETWGMEYFADGQRVGGSGGGKVANLWLNAGRHVFRLQRYHWTGFGRIERIILRAAGPERSKAVSVKVADGRTILRAGEDVKLAILAGGRPEPARLTARLSDAQTREVVASREVEVPAGQQPVAIDVSLRGPREGLFAVSLLEGDRPLDPRDVPPIEITVADTRPIERGGEPKKTLLAEIDCVATEPPHAGQGGAKVVESPAGRYRESGEVGFLFAQHHDQDCGWFAYPFSVPAIQEPYLLETDCPDDAFRTFCIAIREASTDAYPIAGGLDTGGCYACSNRMQTHSILFWPKTRDLRVVFVTAHNDRRGAAASKIRLYRIEGGLPLLDAPPDQGRSFANWYEEGDNFLGVYGAPDRGPAGMLIGTDRWARAIAHMGGTLLVPTVAVYQMALYPSNYNIDFCSSNTYDQVRLILMRCEKYGLGMVGEFHPECRELEWLGGPDQAGTRVLVRKDGHRRTRFDEIPRYHPLHPGNREWYLGMIGEFAERYKDSPAFRGVSLRLMGWANPALNNFHSLDWGYDDLTVGLFEKETGLRTGVKPDDPRRFSLRHEWLMANAREKWIDWRCEKIAQLFAAARDRVRQSRPDLKVYANHCGDLDRESGIDPQRLGALDGVVLVNARHGYGRRAYTYEGYLADTVMRWNLLDPAALASTRGPDGRAAFLFGSGYFEAVEQVVTPEALGFPKGTKRTWMSGVVNPAGRHYLERFAVALAETDAVYLADGGNAYTLGQPLLREFLAEYRRLPPIPFRARADARDPVAVWELTREEDFLFYAVNRERYPVRAMLTLDTAGPVRHLASGAEAGLKDRQLVLDLQPYQLRAFRAPAGSRIAKAVVDAPAAEKEHVGRLVDALEGLARDVAANPARLDAEGRQVLDRVLGEARVAWKEGRLWRARTLMEHPGLVEKVYNRALFFPPAMEWLGSVESLRRLRGRSLPRPGDPALHLRFDRIEDGVTPAEGRLAGVPARVEGGCELREGRMRSALRLDGKTGRAVWAGAGLKAKDLTVSLWVNAENTGERRGIFSRQGDGKGCALFFWNGSLAAEASGPDGTAGCRTADSICHADTWYHLAAVFRSGETLALYVNGDEVKRAPMKTSLEGLDAPFLVGWNGWCGRQNDHAPGRFAGRLDELKVWDRALTPEEILAEALGD